MHCLGVPLVTRSEGTDSSENSLQVTHAASLPSTARAAPSQPMQIRYVHVRWLLYYRTLIWVFDFYQYYKLCTSAVLRSKSSSKGTVYAMP
jgi:hypothetical protein